MINFTLLPEAIKAFTLGPLHLKSRTLKVLDERGVRTIGQLIITINNDFGAVDDLSPTAVKDVLRVMSHFSESVDVNGNVDWFKFWNSLGVLLLPAGYRHNSPSEQILRTLPKVIQEIFSYENETDKQWRTIQRRFGLEGSKKLTLDEIGKAFGLTRERVRQIEAAALTEIREVLLEDRYAGKKYHVQPEIIGLIKGLFEAIASDAKGFVLETELLQRIETAIGSNLKSHLPILHLVFNLFGLNRVNIDNYESTPIWEYGKTEQRKFLEEAIRLIDELLTAEHPTPMDEFDVLVKINSKLHKPKNIDRLQLHKFLELCGSVERREDKLLQGKFEFLKTRGNQAERILTEAGKSLHVEEIVRELNNRLVSKGKKKVELRNIGNILSSDKRFVAIGSSGQRGLRSWENLETGNILELMEKFLISLNRPATEEEIYNYLIERRPVSKKSVAMYLAFQDKFKKADRQRWGLASWTETQNALIWSPEQVADFVANIFKENKVKELEFEAIRKALMQATSVTTNQASGMLRRNPVVSRRKEEKPFKIFAVFNPNYKKDLISPNLKPQRKTETNFQKAEKVVREMLEAESTNQIELSKLVGELKSKHGFYEKTAYQCISQMDFVEKLDLPGSGVRICRIKGTKAISFPQIDKLSISDNAKAAEASKAVQKLTIEEVDIGLFMLGRIFENTLKDFMIMAETVSAYPVGLGNYNKLNNMIQWVESQGIVSDKTALNLLRLERNDRAHSTAPTLEQRNMMLKSSPWMANLYLDYIVFFTDKRDNLIRPSS